MGTPGRVGIIGREHPAGLLRAEIGRAVDSHGGLVLVTGEAGIGKTTLVTDAAEEARRRGALVLSGSCWESDSAPGYWPWTQALSALVRLLASLHDDDGSVAAINSDNQTKLVVRELEKYAMRTADKGEGERPRKLWLHFFESPVEITGDGRVQGFRTERTERSEGHEGTFYVWGSVAELPAGLHDGHASVLD